MRNKASRNNGLGFFGFCQRIRKTLADNHLDTCERYTGIILESAHKMEKLITTLLKFSAYYTDGA